MEFSYLFVAAAVPDPTTDKKKSDHIEPNCHHENVCHSPPPMGIKKDLYREPTVHDKSLAVSLDTRAHRSV